MPQPTQLSPVDWPKKCTPDSASPVQRTSRSYPLLILAQRRVERQPSPREMEKGAHAKMAKRHQKSSFCCCCFVFFEEEEKEVANLRFFTQVRATTSISTKKEKDKKEKIQTGTGETLTTAKTKNIKTSAYNKRGATPPHAPPATDHPEVLLLSPCPPGEWRDRAPETSCQRERAALRQEKGAGRRCRG